MARAQPILGYRSKSEAATAMKNDGVPTHIIAERLGIESRAVAALTTSRTRTLERRVTSYPVDRAVVISKDRLSRLESHAKKRGIPAVDVAKRIIDIVIDDDIVDNVLDDMG